MLRHLIAALLAATTLSATPAQDTPPVEVTFNISVRGQRLGQELVTLSRTPDGWLISSTGRQAGPAEFTIDKFEAAYTIDWRPRSLSLEATRQGQVATLATTFSAAGATNVIGNGPDRKTTTVPVSSRTVMLPNDFFGAYEALAARLTGAQVGATFPLYVAPTAEVTATVTAITPQRLQTPDALVQLKHFSLSVRNPAGNVLVDIGVDATGRLARVAVPAAGILVLRADLSNVMTRDVTFTNAEDRPAFIPGLGFTIAATTTAPANATSPLPAVVLVGGANGADRDETVAGVTIHGQLAGALAKAGFYVVRYDKRGVGQSGGRTESLTLQDYADDATTVVKWLRKQKAVDSNRIAVIGRAEGAAAAMMAASRTGDIAALGLVSAPGMTGQEFVLAQQNQALARSNDSPEVKAAKIQLQMRIMDAARTGKGWENVPPAMQKQADTLWFKSWVEFDPAALMKKVDQPVLILQGTRDTEFPPLNAERLEVMALARKGKAAGLTRKVLMPGLNHLLVPAPTGEVTEYSTLTTKTIPADVPQAIIEWLRAAMPEKKK